MLFLWWCFFRKIGRIACCLWCDTISPYFVRVYDPDGQTPQMSELQTLWQWQKNWHWVGSDTKLNFWILCLVSIRKAMTKILSSLALIASSVNIYIIKIYFLLCGISMCFYIFLYVFLCGNPIFFFLILCFWVKFVIYGGKLIIFQWKFVMFFDISYVFQFLPFKLFFEGYGMKF